MIPIYEAKGLLTHRDVSPERISQIPRALVLFRQNVNLDHFVITLADQGQLLAYQHDLIMLGGNTIEGPGLWPDEFCGQSVSSDDLSMNFASILLPTGLIAVLASPHRAHDQLDRFRTERGTNAIHHVAIHVTDFEEARKSWLAQAFTPLSKLLDDGDLAQQFLRNREGQIVELIRRSNQNQATFTCENLEGLRQSEGERR